MQVWSFLLLMWHTFGTADYWQSPYLFSLMPILSVVANYWGSPALAYFSKPSMYFLCPPLIRTSHFLPLLGYDHNSCKLTTVLRGFCSKSKERIQRWYYCSLFHSVKSYGCIPYSWNGTVRELLAPEVCCCLLSAAVFPFLFLVSAYHFLGSYSLQFLQGLILIVTSRH